MRVVSVIASRLAVCCSIAIGLLFPASAMAGYRISMPTPSSPLQAIAPEGTTTINRFHMAGGHGSWEFPEPRDMDEQYFQGANPVCRRDSRWQRVTCRVRPGPATVISDEGNDIVQFWGDVDIAEIATGVGNDTIQIDGTGGSRGRIDGGPDDSEGVASYGEGDAIEVRSGWRVDLAAGVAQPNSGNEGTTFTFQNIENIRRPLGRGTSVLLGNDAGNHIAGSERPTDAGQSTPDGNDTIDGRGGHDKLVGDSGDDRISGGPGADQIYCGEGTDTVPDAEAVDTIAADCEVVMRRLDVSVSGEQLVGDLVELDVTVANTTGEPVSDLRYESGQGTPGIVYNTAPYSEFHRALFTPAGGPAPDLVNALGTDQSAEHQYLVGIDSPGFVMARAEVTGTRPDGGLATGGGRAEIYAANRDLEPWEQAMEFTGAWAVIQDQLRREVDASYARMHESIIAALRKTTPSGKAAAKNTLLERQLAYRFAESEKSLSWLPKKTPAAIKAVLAYSAQKSAAGTKLLKGKLGNLYNRGVEIPWDYWTGAVADDPYGDVWVGQALYEESGAWKDKAGGFLGDAVALLEDPARRHEFKAKVDETIANLSRTVVEKVKASPDQIKKFARLVIEDPVRAGQFIGDIEGKIRVELGWAVAEGMVTGGTANTAKAVLGVGTRAHSFAKAGDFVEDAGRGVPALSSADELAGAVDMPTAVQLGMPEADQGILQGIVTKLEEKARKHGVDLKLGLSFRPSNPHSIGVKDGVGKVLFVKAKAGTELDLMLGMHPDGLGKVAIYKPKLPKDYAMLPAKLRREIDERMGDMNKAYKDWHDPGSDLGRAQRKKGATFRNNIGVEDQATTTTVNMKLSGKKSGDTIVVRYDHLNVDGRQIVKKGDPKWVVSDYDGNAILTADGQNLPASIRGMIELEANILIAQAGKKGLRTGFHGFTHNGFDLKGKDYRYVYKYLLEGMNPAQKKKALETYLAKYAEGGNADPIYQKLLSGDLGGDFVIRVTSSGTGVGQGT